MLSNNQNQNILHNFLIIHEMQKLFLATFRMLKYKKALYESVRYSFNSDNTPRFFFKKREESKPLLAQPPMQVEPKLKNESLFQDEDIKRYLEDYNRFFNQQRNQLPIFLRKLTKCMNHSVFLMHEQQFTNIYYRINKYSSELVLKPHQFLEIIIFLQKYIEYYSKQHPIETLNVTNGFEHRATILGATFVYNGQFSLTQCIAVFQILTKIGSISMLFLTNLTKVLKTQFQAQGSKEKIRLQHLLTILNTYFIKSNHTILQNVLYDMTLNYLLKHNNLIKKSPIIFKIDMLSILLRVDLMNFYLSDRNQLRQMLQRLTDQILPIIKSSTLELGQLKNADNEISLRHAVYLLESCDQFIIKNTKSFIQSKIISLAESICDQGIKSINTYSEEPNQLNYYLLFSIIFNKHNRLFPENIKMPIELIKQDLNNMKQEDFNPLIKFYYQSKEKSHHAAQFINEFYKLMLKNDQFVPSIIKFVLDTAEVQKIAEILHDLIIFYSKNSLRLKSREKILMLELLYYASIKNQDILQEKGYVELLETLQAQIKELSKDKITFIRQLQATILLFRNRQLNSILFQNIFSGDKFKDYLKLPHQNQFERNEYQIACLHIFAELISHNLAQTKTEILQEFSQHIIYQFLVLLYPQTLPNVRKSSKSLYFLQDEETFIKNMEIIIGLASRIQKYSYLIWDIFINTYRIRSKSIRESAFPILKRLFLNAFHKEKARKVVLLTTLTNFMASGIVIASMEQKKELFQACLVPLIQQNMEEKFHYHCFLQITFNARSIGVLSDQMFTMIVKRYLSASKNMEGSFRTSLLLLLYGMKMKNSEKNIYRHQYKQQEIYIKIYLNKEYIIVSSRRQHDRLKSIGSPNKNIVIARGKYISVLLSYGGNELLKIGNAILSYVEDCDDYCEFMMIVHSFQIGAFNLEDQSIKKFVMKLNEAFFSRIEYFYGQKLLCKNDYQSLITTISSNHLRLNDCQK